MGDDAVDGEIRCGECGFLAREWTRQDMERTLVHTDRFLDLWSAATRPDLGVEVESIAGRARTSIHDGTGSAQSIHSLWHALVAISRARRRGGDVVPQDTGVVERINVSGGGVPKLPVERADVDHHGVVGDTQAARVHHGRPWQALCLWSDEVIQELAAEGHPISAGAAGENLTLAGIDWSTMRAGLTLDIGSVRCQLSAPAEPCAKNRQWFLDGRIELMDHARHPGSSRWYATVVRPGAITAGAPVVVEPAS